MSLKLVRPLSISTMVSQARQMSMTTSTVDEDEIVKHSKLMDNWWDPNGNMNRLHMMNSVRVPFIKDGLIDTTLEDNTESVLANKKILDVGCGGGFLTEGLAHLGASVTGIDATRDLIAVAQRHSSLNTRLKVKPIYFYTTVEDHVKEFSECYDAVVASEVVEHVNNKQLFLESCVRAVRPGGKLFFTTPNRTLHTAFYLIILQEYILKRLQKGFHQYEKLITPLELRSMLEKLGCKHEKTQGYKYNISRSQWVVTSNNDNFYAMRFSKLP